MGGVVHESGDGVTGWMVGDAVFGEGCGTFVGYALASPDQLATLPSGASFPEAANLPLAASTALAAAAHMAVCRTGWAVAGAGTVPNVSDRDERVDLSDRGAPAPVWESRRFPNLSRLGSSTRARSARVWPGSRCWR